MGYKVEFSKKFEKAFLKLDSFTQRMIMKWIEANLQNTHQPRQFGKALQGNKKGFWRYRVGNYRLIADIQDNRLVILILEAGHRKNIYK